MVTTPFSYSSTEKKINVTACGKMPLCLCTWRCSFRETDKINSKKSGLNETGRELGLLIERATSPISITENLEIQHVPFLLVMTDEFRDG